MVWTGSNWLRIGTSGGLLWTRWWIFGFLKMSGNLLSGCTISSFSGRAKLRKQVSKFSLLPLFPYYLYLFIFILPFLDRFVLFFLSSISVFKYLLENIKGAHETGFSMETLDCRTDNSWVDFHDLGRFISTVRNQKETKTNKFQNISKVILIINT
jgi:hypothetical protein